jgi:hypothetical protein
MPDTPNPRDIARFAIRDGEAWHDRRLPEVGRALDAALDEVERLTEALLREQIRPREFGE